MKIMNKNLFARHSMANLIDILIPGSPVIYAFFYKELVLFDFLNPVQVFAVVYLIFNLIALLSTRGNSIGYNLMGLRLIDRKSGKKSLLKNGLRILFIAAFFFLIVKNNEIDSLFLIVLLFLVIPIPVNHQDQVFYSLLNRMLGIVQSVQYNNSINKV
ncbi:MAG: hypothetical protein SCALA702_01000 [Melioribacteraceae bacterium]|nr:MAG: hypothetical protein SCALA702_01000 [Melioribacteraceae bacterium]